MADPLLSLSRRTFLARGTGAALTSVSAGLAAQSIFAKPARAQVFADYRALVCIFLDGGCDNWSLLPPFDDVSHSAYGTARAEISLSRNQLAATVLRPENDLGGYAYAFHPNLEPLLEVFNSGDLAVVQNIGTLIEPATPRSVLEGIVRLPAQLQSHNSQSRYFLSGIPEGEQTGWGGRIADLLRSANSSPQLTCIDATNNSSFLYGAETTPYAVRDDGAAIPLDGARNVFRSTLGSQTLTQITTSASQNLLRNDYGEIMRRALSAGSSISSIFAGVADDQIPELLDSTNPLSMQLARVARTIIGATPLGMRRQIFFTTLKGWDSHSDQARNNERMAQLSSAMRGFWQVMRRWGLSNNVTTFTGSDFGRMLAGNGDGSDHGWGGAQLVMGGAVKGARVLGTPPVVGLSTASTIGGGRLVPTTSVDQLAATLGRWMGVDTANHSYVAPNLKNFEEKFHILDIF